MFAFPGSLAAAVVVAAATGAGAGADVDADDVVVAVGCGEWNEWPRKCLLGENSTVETCYVGETLLGMDSIRVVESKWTVGVGSAVAVDADADADADVDAGAGAGVGVGVGADVEEGKKKSWIESYGTE